jgi:hypothetical protein
MALRSDDQPSRWSVYVEVRDCLRGILAPRLTLPHLLANGPGISKKARVRRPMRPLQGVAISKIALNK